MVQRVQVELRDEDVEPLRALAWKDHRSLREQAGFLLHLKIQEEAAGFDEAAAIVEVA